MARPVFRHISRLSTWICAVAASFIDALPNRSALRPLNVN